MRPDYIAGLLVGVAFFVGGVVGVLVASFGLAPEVMPCTEEVHGAVFEWHTGPTDDEGFSEMLGKLERGGWQNITRIPGTAWDLRAECNP